MRNEFHTEVDCRQKNHHDSRICGDVFLSRMIKEEKRIIAVLSDGMGHGVKANILATLSSTMALNFTIEHKEIERIAEIIMNTLPVCAERKISYATFSIIDIDSQGFTRILEYDNPLAIIFRGPAVFTPRWEKVMLKGENHSGKILNTCSFTATLEDRIVIMSDGIVQSGMGSEKHPFGWGRENVESYALSLIAGDPTISATALSSKILNMAHKNDGYQLKDDASCATVYFREPRKLLICTGPPFDSEKDRVLAGIVENFIGRVILSGGTTADIIARELERKINDNLEFTDPELPPESFMEGIELVTEGILTLQKVSRIIDIYPNHTPGKGPADKIVKLIMDSDEISFIIGTRINEAHQDPTLPVDLEIRRNVVRRIAAMLEEKWLKQVDLEYI
ncbi:MAG: serine/threonine-protein phosphatase [Bacteroidales bacterium]|nr:serine/threonine-protein phosphatase [Bacteroidales bacterium]